MARGNSDHSRVGLPGGTVDEGNVHSCADSIWIELRLDLDKANNDSGAFLQGFWNIRQRTDCILDDSGGGFKQPRLLRLNSPVGAQPKLIFPEAKEIRKLFEMVRARNIHEPVALRIDFGSNLIEVMLLELLRIPSDRIADKPLTWTVTTPTALFNKRLYGLEGRPQLCIDGVSQLARTFDGCATMFLDDADNPVLQFLFDNPAFNESGAADEKIVAGEENLSHATSSRDSLPFLFLVRKVVCRHDNALRGSDSNKGCT